MSLHWRRWPRRLTSVHIAALVLLALVLAGCKPSEEKRGTERRLDDATRAISLSSEDVARIDPAVSRRFIAWCARAAFLGDATSSSCQTPDVLAALGASSPLRPAAVELKAWDGYTTPDDRKALQAAIGQQLEAARQALIAELTVAHWRWSAKLAEQVDRFQLAVAGSMGDSFVRKLPPDLGLAIQGAVKLDAFKKGLEQEAAVLANLGSKGDPLHDETSRDIYGWLEKVSRASAVGNVTAQREAIVGTADNAKWDSAAQTYSPVGTPDVAALSAGRSNPTASNAFDDFLTRANAAEALRSGLPRFRMHVSNLFDSRAADQLARDCDALLKLDPDSFDAVCGPVAPALSHALDILQRNAKREGPPSGPATTPQPGGPSVGDASDLAQLKQSLRSVVGWSGVVAREELPKPEPAVIDGLRQRIREASRAYSEAALAGYLEGRVVPTIELETAHEQLKAAARGDLPDRLRHPFALLDPSDAAQARDDTIRMLRIVERQHAMLPDAVQFDVATRALRDDLTVLERVLANPATLTDYAQVVRKIDPQKVKDFHKSSAAEIDRLASDRRKLWAMKYAGVPAVLDTWRGPRGPPGDPKFPKSAQVLEAIEQIGGNPTKAIKAFSALRAEHVEFYRAIPSGEIADAWHFGRENPVRWMLGLLSPADLARAQVGLRSVAGVAPDVALGEGWAELNSALVEMRQNLVVELQSRAAQPGRYPPGYPPGRPPEARKAAERYLLSWESREPTRIERQFRVQITQEMYPDVIDIPAAARAELRAQVASVLDAEVARVEQAYRSLYGERNGTGGLLDRAARAVDALTPDELVALEEAKAKLAEAVSTIQKRVGHAEAHKYVDVKPERWSWWKGGFGPDAGSAGIPPEPPPRPGPAPRGTTFLFTNSALERNLVVITDLQSAIEAKLKAAETIASRSIEPPPVGAQMGRAVATRDDWSRSGAFDFSRMLSRPGAAATRYPEALKDWDGFFAGKEQSKQPFDYQSFVKEFRNFRGVGGGIHLGETAVPAANTVDALQRGAAISYDHLSKMIALRLSTGEAFQYGPVDPQVLKALFAFVTAYPGINLALTIGAAGESRTVHEQGGTPVLLDPHFVDTKVGQNLYLADTIPWSLHEAMLPNHQPNPAATSFGPVYQKWRLEQEQEAESLVELIQPVLRLGETSAEYWRQHLDSRGRLKSLLMAGASAKDWEEFLERYSDIEAAALSDSAEIKQLQAQARIFEAAGYDGATLTSALIILSGRGTWTDSLFREDFPLLGRRLQGLDVIPESETSRAARLAKQLKAKQLKPEDRESLNLVASYMTGGLAAVRPKFRQAAREWLEKSTAGTSPLSFLRTENDRALRALLLTRLAVDREQANEAVVTVDVLRLAASAILELNRQAGKTESLKDIAMELRSFFLDTPALAVLFDQQVTFELADTRIKLTPLMKYRYATSAVAVTPRGLVYSLDGSDPNKPIAARQLEQLAAAANDNFEEISAAYPPLDEIRKYAGLAAFLRWAACGRVVNGECARREGVTIDFSSLGRYPLRDHVGTPTPDMDAR